MKATIIQENGRTYFQMEIQSFPSEAEMVELSRKAIQETAAALYTKAYSALVAEAQVVTIKQAAEILCLPGTAEVQDLIKLKTGHPRRLHCIEPDSGDIRYRKVRLSELRRWATESEDPSILQRIMRFENKQTRRKK